MLAYLTLRVEIKFCVLTCPGAFCLFKSICHTYVNVKSKLYNLHEIRSKERNQIIYDFSSYFIAFLIDRTKII